jgi:hypothetical protein
MTYNAIIGTSYPHGTSGADSKLACAAWTMYSLPVKKKQQAPHYFSPSRSGLPVTILIVLKFKQISLQGIGYSYAIDFFLFAYRRTRSSTGCITTTAPLPPPRAFFILSIISSTSSDLTTVATSLLVVY